MKVFNLRRQTHTHTHTRGRKIIYKRKKKKLCYDYICFSEEEAEARGVVFTDCWRTGRFCWDDIDLLMTEELVADAALARVGFWTLPADIEDRSGWIPPAEAAVPLPELNWKYFGSIFELSGGFNELKEIWLI